jgi:methylated-DNA-[protein]-cysteine S-methyltransferase
MSDKKEVLNCNLYETRLGWMGIIISEKGPRRVILPCKSKKEVLDQLVDCGCQLEDRDSDDLVDLTNRLKRYFEGEDADFADRLDLSGTTGFQRKVWSIVRNIPRGETRSYGWVARQLGSPKAARAVGQAMGRNPLPIIIPCHRVISENGNLGGFGGGLELKKSLLDMEKAA